MLARLAVLVVVIGLSSRAAAQAESLELAARFVVTSGVSGRFAEPRCGEPVPFEVTPFARYAARLTEADANGRLPFVVDTGGFFEPYGIGRYFAQTDPGAIARLVAELGYDAMALGVKDLQSPRSGFTAVAAELASRGIPYVATNLRCEPAAASLCDVVVDGDDALPIVEHDTERVAFLAFVDPGVLSDVTPANAAGVVLAPLADAVRDAVRLAHAQGATLVVVSVDNGSGSRSLTDALDLAAALPEDARPDLLLAARAGDSVLFTRPATFHPALAAAPPGGAAEVRVRDNPDLRGYEMLVRRLEPADAPAPALVRFAEASGPRYCAALGGPMRGGRLDRALDAAGFLELSSNIIRRETDAEIVVLNRALVHEDASADAGHVLSPANVHVALQFDDPIMVATVPASWLQQLARKAAANDQLRMFGMTIANAGAAGEAITVNGRPLDMRGRYRIATIGFLAQGGGGFFPPGATFRPAGEQTVRAALLEHLAVERAGDPRDGFRDPADRLEWVFDIASDATFGGAAIENPGGYEDTQFQRSDNVAYGTQHVLHLVGRSRLYSLQNELVARYRAIRNDDGSREESDDILMYRASFYSLGMRTRNDAFYVPDPFLESYVETEFTIPEARTFRHLLVRPTAGVRFTVTPHFALKLQGGFEVEALEPGAKPSPGVGVQLALAPWQIFQSGTRNARMSGTLDYFVSRLGSLDRQALRGNLELSMQLTSIFGLAFTSTLFVINEHGARGSVAFNATAAVRLAYFVRAQR